MNSHFSIKSIPTFQHVMSMILFLSILTLVGGDYMLNFSLFGFEIYAFRLVLLFAVGYLALTKHLVLYNSRFSKYVFFAFLFWLLYAVVSLLWTPNIIFGIKEIYYCIIGVIIYLVFLSIINQIDDFTAKFELAWVCVYICVFCFAILEILNQNHLDGEYLNTLTMLGYYHNINFVPVVTFNNPNPFASYLCLAWVISIYYILKNSNLNLHFSVLMSSLFLISLTGSRLSLILIGSSVLLLLILFSFKFIREKLKINFSWKTALLIVVGVFLLIFISIKFNKFDEIPETELVSRNTEKLTSNPSINNKPNEVVKPKIIKENKTALNLVEVTNNIVQAEKASGPDKIFMISRSLNNRLHDNKKVYLRLGNIKDFGLNSFSNNHLNDVLFLIIIFSIICLFFMFFGYFSLKTNWGKQNMYYLLIGILFFVPFIFFQHSFIHGAEAQKSTVIVSSAKETHVHKTDFIQVSLNADLAEKIMKMDSVLIVNKVVEAQSTNKILNSDEVRKNLILNGLDFLKDSKYLGVGAGGYRELNSQNKGIRPTGKILGAHNFIIEILVQYGVIVFSVALFIFGWITLFLLKSFYNKNWSAEHTLSLLLLVCIMITGNSNSTFLSLPLNWLTLILFLLNSVELIRREKV